MAEKHTILFIDDESSILRAMKRVFHGERYKLVLADDGHKALAFMKQQEVHVVVSDMKMPKMSGADFLQQVATLYPETYRIVLSGYADVKTTLSAVNQGKVHRFMQKPWDNEDMIAAVDQGIERFKLHAQRDELQHKLTLQNQKLKEVNQSLEARVEQRTLQIKAALNRAEQSAQSTRKVVYNMISTLPSINGGLGKRVGQLAEKIAVQLGLEKKLISDIAYAGLIHQIGMLDADAKVHNTPFSELNPNQQDKYMNQGSQALLILSPSQALQSVADIVSNQFEFVNGKGYPRHIQEDEIPIGAKILSVARDYFRYQAGLIEQEKSDAKTAAQKINNFVGLRYSREVVDALIKVTSKQVDTGPSDGLRTSDLKPGMVLKESLFNDKDILILPQDHVLDEASISKLQTLEKRFDFILHVQIKV
ncbi:HD domain-containing phosphohydrolase [Glaciecola siphonariae]|uniref:HD domain-containing phosphohydrolase n=1 Tax=Glaciecola siphonariae TaxID=521012 RepID=A0ABV9M0I5_9ALTE